MAHFRTVQTRMWREDEWYLDLPTDARYFWIYLFTNPSASICGMYRLPIKTIVNESGLPEKRVKELFTLFAQAGKAHYEDGVIWVVRMRENQLGGRISQNQQTGIDKDLAKIPPCPLKNRYLQHYGYPIDTLLQTPDTLSIGVRYDTVTDTLHNDTVEGAAAPQPPQPGPKQAASLPAAIQVYEDNGGKYKSGKLSDGTTYRDKARQFITEHVTDTPESLMLWGRVVAGYTSQWAKTSYTIMVNDYYLMGYAPGDKKPGRSNGNGKLATGFGLSSLSGGAKAPEPTAEFLAEWARLNEPDGPG